MIGFRLRLKKLSDGRLMFSIPVRYKILLLGIGLLILVSLIVTRAEGGGSIFIRQNAIPLIICFLSLMGAAYHECWIFDKNQGQIIHQNGLIVFHSNHSYRIEDFKQIEVSRMGMAGRNETSNLTAKMPVRRIWALSIIEKTGKVRTIEIYRRLQLSRAERDASTLSDYCDLSLRSCRDA
jgi:hypothetical protein